MQVHVEYQRGVAEANRFSERGPVWSGRVFKGSWAVCGPPPLWFSFFARQGERTSYTLRIEVFTVNRRSWLLAPVVIQGASIDSFESEFINKFQDDAFSRRVIARYRKRESPWCAFGLAQLQKVFSKDVVERFNDRTVQLLCNPAALCYSGLDPFDGLSPR